MPGSGMGQGVWKPNDDRAIRAAAAASGGGGPTFKDQFVDTINTLIENHVPDIGTSWTKISSGGSAVVNPSGSATWPSAPEIYYYLANPDPPVNCYLEVTVSFGAAYSGPLYFGMRGITGSTALGYDIYIDFGLASCLLESSGTGTLFDASAFIPTAGNDKTYKITAVGNTITLYVNGVQQFQGTNSDHPLAGNATFYWNPLNQSQRSFCKHFESGPFP